MTGRPAFWLWAAGCAIGAYTVVITVVPRAEVFGLAARIGLGALLALLLAAFWLFHRIRPVRAQPLTYAVMALAWGSFGAFSVAFAANAAFLRLLSKTAGLEFADRWGDAIAAPIDEEIAKAAGVVLLALIAPQVISGPLAGFGYGALAGLGFQVVENYLYVFNTIIATGGIREVDGTLASLLARVAFSAWWSHWAMTAVSGAGLGYLLGRPGRPMLRRVCYGVGGLLLAMLMHAWWDTPFLAESFLLKGLPLLAIVIVVYLLARRDYRITGARSAVIPSGMPSEE